MPTGLVSIVFVVSFVTALPGAVVKEIEKSNTESKEGKEEPCIKLVEIAKAASEITEVAKDESSLATTDALAPTPGSNLAADQAGSGQTQTARLAPASPGQPSPKIRVFVTGTPVDSVRDLKEGLPGAARWVQVVESREEAELVVDVVERKSEKQQSYSSDPTRNLFNSIIPEIRYTVIANVVEGDQTTTLSGSKTSSTSMWRIAAGELAKAIDDHVEENHERLLLRRPWLPVLGAEYVTITKELKKTLALKESQGVVFTTVDDGGPAGMADLQAGDIIMESARIGIKKSVDLTRLLAARKPGDLLVLRIKRAGGDKTVSVQLGSPLSP